MAGMYSNHEKAVVAHRRCRINKLTRKALFVYGVVARWKEGSSYQGLNIFNRFNVCQVTPALQNIF